MQYHATTSCDQGDVVLFWPENLPAGFCHTLSSPGGRELLEQLHRDAKLTWLGGAESDFEYRLTIFLNEPVAAALRPFSRLDWTFERMQVPGAGFFGGLDAITEDRESLQQSRIFSRVDLPPGEYRAEVLSLVYPNPHDLLNQWLKSRLGARTFWQLRMLENLGAVAIFVLIISGLCAFSGRLIFVAIAIAAALVEAMVVWRLARSPADEQRSLALEEFAAAHPHWVVHLTGLDSAR